MSVIPVAAREREAVEADRSVPRLSNRSLAGTWVAMAAAFGAAAIVYGPILWKLWRDCLDDDSYSHGLLVLPVALFLVWQKRRTLASTPLAPHSAGLIVILAAMALYAAGTLGAELFTTRVSFVVLLAGAVLYVCGPAHLRALAFPIAFLLLMIPLPAIVFDRMTQSLQLVASSLGERMLRSADIPVLRDGNVLTLATITLNVTDACSGIRSLMALLTVTSLAAYLMEPTGIRQVAITLSAVPLAILLNGLRVAVTGIAAVRISPDMARGAIHEASGWAVFVLAIGCVWLIHRAFEAAATHMPRTASEAA